jgi:flavin-dependent dehydrogenase
MASREVVILGGGISGLAAADEFEKRGDAVTILTPEGSYDKNNFRSVYTTFQGQTEYLLSSFSGQTLRPLSKFRLVTDTSEVQLDGKGYYMVDFPAALSDLRSKLRTTRIEEFNKQTGELRIADSRDGVSIQINGKKMHPDAVLDCSGEAAVTNRENPITEFVYGGLFRGDTRDREMIIAFVGEMGGTCWVNPSIQPGYIDVVVSGWGWKSDLGKFVGEGEQRLRILRDFLIEKNVVLFDKNTPDITFSGSIRSEVRHRTQAHHVYAAGDAAGVAVPKTGDCFRWAAREGQLVAGAVHEGLSPNKAAKMIYKDRPLLKDLLLQGATVYRLNKQITGDLGTSVEPINGLIQRHPELKEMAEEFFVNETMHPRLLLCILQNEHFREIFVKSLLAEISIALLGIERIKPFYAFPSIESI